MQISYILYKLGITDGYVCAWLLKFVSCSVTEGEVAGVGAAGALHNFWPQVNTDQF